MTAIHPEWRTPVDILNTHHFKSALLSTVVTILINLRFLIIVASPLWFSEYLFCLKEPPFSKLTLTVNDIVPNMYISHVGHIKKLS